MDRIDLHTHTDRSDGTESPRQVVDRAVQAGLALLAITDHDTTDALASARAAAEGTGLAIVAGCEISTRIPTGSLHVLAWGFDEQDAGLQDLLARIREARRARNAQMRERLARLGLPLEEAEVARHAVGPVVARPHFARAMRERGYVAELQEAFDRWIGDDGPAYVLGDLPSPQEAIRTVVAAGGVAGLAHPRQLRLPGRPALERLVTGLVAAGLEALEVDHPSHLPAQRRLFREVARRFGLVATGGSDFHGDAKPHLAVGVGDGSVDLRRSVWDALSARRRRRRSAL